MDTLRLLYALLAFTLSLQLVSSQLAGGEMMRKPGVGTRDALKTPLATQQPPQGASRTGEEGLDATPPKESPGPARSRPKRHGREQPEEPECRLQSLLVRVEDLGLGYDSEETILFKYCSGRCPKARSNHALTLTLLLQKSQIPALGEPCCRPSHYEDVAFLDDGHQWHQVEKLSASSCSCVG